MAWNKLVYLTLLLFGFESSTKSQTVVVDYSELAVDAEDHKNNILDFLNESDVIKRYKYKYDILLNELKGPSETRRIVLGRNTSIASVPWQASLRERSYPICGGSVLTDIWILTAAHCLLRAHATDLTVRLGSSWKTHGGEMYDVKESFVHPRYVSTTKVNDAGLVRLHTPLRFSARVLPIRLVQRDTKLPANEVAIVSGWGKLMEGGMSATFLQSAGIATIAMKLCRRSGLQPKSIDPHSMFCAGSFNQPSPDACQGDSGGPIVFDGVQIGVVSWGLGCARGNFPGVYTRLAHPVIRDWIQEHIVEKIDANITFR
ncbi:trypsin-1-like isoform X2 [Leptidea sinapis]|uniref:trypsin-1-like isoform X2 n=1 Tax=Leptidea sinapis TaxID=189913 RepID=UPI0021228FB3|nr:trypsin-1-like isoform X2 [Leptidea sinapis]